MLFWKTALSAPQQRFRIVTWILGRRVSAVCLVMTIAILTNLSGVEVG
jgi:hypothetical protein